MSVNPKTKMTQLLEAPKDLLLPAPAVPANVEPRANDAVTLALQNARRLEFRGLKQAPVTPAELRERADLARIAFRSGNKVNLH